MNLRIEWLDKQRFSDTVIETDISADLARMPRHEAILRALHRNGTRLLNSILPAHDRQMRFAQGTATPVGDPWEVLVTLPDGGTLVYAMQACDATGFDTGEVARLQTSQSLTQPLAQLSSPAWELV